MKKFVSLTLCTVFLFALAACGGKEASPSQPASQPVTIVPPAESASASLPYEEPVELERAFLTGLEKGPDYPEGKRITAVMVNNISSSRPTRGLSECQVLVEIKVEGGITRFMALYEDYEKIPEIGSVRSARDQFFQLLLPFWGFYVHDGQSQMMNQFLKDWDYGGFDLSAGKYGLSSGGPADGLLAWRDPARRAAGFPTEYTEYTDGAHIAQTIQNNNLDDHREYGSPMFNFVPYNEPPRVPTGGPMPELAVIHSSSYITQFSYSNGKYLMNQFNSSRGVVEPTIDENADGAQVSFDNLIVLFAPMSLYGDTPLVKVDYMGGGGYYFSQGHYEFLIWQKGGPNQALQLYMGDKSENPVFINPGNTYLAVVDDNMLPDFDSAMKSGNAGQVAAGGEVNQNETETED